MSPTPMPKATPSPTAPPPSDILPYDSMLLFVLDDPISSKSSKSGQIVRAHLKEPIVVAGQTVAPAGTPAQIKILDSSAADIADQYGFVDIFFEPMTLPDGRTLPLRTLITRLTPNVTAGHGSTVEAEDTVGDIFVPYYSLWQIVRHGKNFVLGAGSLMPARTEATIAPGRDGKLSIEVPRPTAQSTEPPSPTFPVMPLATPYGPFGAPRPRTPPSPPPASASPAPSASPTML